MFSDISLDVVQLEERLIWDQEVVGSSPAIQILTGRSVSDPVILLANEINCRLSFFAAVYAVTLNSCLRQLLSVTSTSCRREAPSMFYTGRNIPIRFDNIPEAIFRYYERNKCFTSDISIIIGTDSQNFSDTKVVSVICVIAAGHGGIFFYRINREPIIKDIRRKLHVETNDSLDIAEQLVNMMEAEKKYEEMFLTCPISIHVDAGNSEKGKTKALIPELVGWIKACGYEATVKPDSFVASTIADRISK